MTRALRTGARSSLTTFLGLTLAVVGVQAATTVPALATPSGGHLVINEISGGNGAGTASTDEYVELHNPTDFTISFTGTVQYKSAAGATYAASSPVFDAVVPAGGYFLLAGINYSGIAVPDARYTFDMTSSTTGGGHIALTGATSSGTLPTNDPLRVDLIGWGTANYPEGTAAPAHPAAGGSLRRTNGIDTDNNSVDFMAVTNRTPRSSTSPVTTLTAPGSQSFEVNKPITPLTLAAAGGQAPYVYAVTSGTLPDGLTLNPTTGQITGTPSAVRAAQPVTVRATDANGDPVRSTFSIAVNDAPPPVLPVTLTNPGAQAGTVGNSVRPITLAATGGSGVYTYAIDTGALPAGVTLNGQTGVISGTPSAAGISSVQVKATDTAGVSATAAFSYAISLGSLTPGTPTVDDVTPVVGQLLTASPGVWGPAPVQTSYQWLADGQPIPGAMAATFLVTADVLGTALSVRVTGTRDWYLPRTEDSAATTRVVGPVTVTNPGARTFAVDRDLVPFTIAASGGAAPYRYAVTGGVLPTGVVLDPDTGEVSGTPTLPTDASDVEVTVSDAHGNVGTTRFSVAVALGTLTPAVPSVDDTTPVVGQRLTALPGAWGPGQVTLSYQWLADGEPIPGAVNASYLVTSDVVGATLTVRVSGTKPHYVTALRDSEPTSAVVAPVSVSMPSVPAFTVGRQIASVTVAVEGGVAPYRYSLTGGTLPGGLRFDALTGAFTGTPTSTTTSDLEVTVTDADGNTGSTTFRVSVTAAPSTPTKPPVKPDPSKPSAVKPTMRVSMKPVSQRPTRAVRLRIRVAGVAVTGPVVIRAGGRLVRGRAVNGVVKLSAAQIRKLVKSKKKATLRTKVRRVRAEVRFLGGVVPVSTTLVIRVKRVPR